jgi:DNA-binding NtrC family response regulator
MGSNAARTILIVEPDADTRSALRNTFETEGYTVIATGGAADALSLLAAPEIKLVVTELYLENGQDTCLLHSIRQASAHEKKRVLAYTRHGRAEDREWAIAEGADGYVLKKNGEKRLLEVAGRLARRKRATKKRARKTTPERR